MGDDGLYVAAAEDVEENMATWLIGVNKLRVQPFNVPTRNTLFACEGEAIVQNIVIFAVLLFFLENGTVCRTVFR